ncbi:MAG: hypothetical protein V4507_05900 [Verrucomicrobiota bacterium]
MIKTNSTASTLNKIQYFVLSVILLVAATPSAHAQIIQIDFGNAVSPIQSGWTYWGLETTGSTFLPSKTFVTSAGSITATISSNFTLDGSGNLQASAVAPSTRDRSLETPANSGAFTESNLYRDMVINVGSGGGLALELSGLTPNTQYSLTLYDYDAGTDATTVATRTNVFTNITNGASANLGSVTYKTVPAGGTLTINEQYTVTATLTSDSSGRLIVTEAKNSFAGQTDNFAGLNGFSLSSIPEPSAYFAFLLSGVGIFAILGTRKLKSIS